MKRRPRAGFTLVELIVVLAILAVLLVVIMPRLTGYISDARETAAQNNAAAVLDAAELYIVDRERDGLDIAASLDQDDLSGYLEHLDAEDTVSLSLTYQAASNDYAISGTYSDGTYTVAIPAMTVTRIETP